MSKVVVLVKFELDTCDLRTAVDRLEDSLSALGIASDDFLVEDSEFSVLSAVIE